MERVEAIESVLCAENHLVAESGSGIIFGGLEYIIWYGID